MAKAMNTAKFREELVKTMPGYKWTVHRSFPKLDDSGTYALCATGTQSIGFNRMSTLQIIRRERDGHITYEAKSSGFGKRAPWLHTTIDGTLARALRGLQNHYETMASEYLRHACDLQSGRTEVKCR